MGWGRACTRTASLTLRAAPSHDAPSTLPRRAASPVADALLVCEVPELSADEAGAVQAALLAHAALAAAPPPKPKPGRKAPPAAPLPVYPSLPATAHPLDWEGVPLPHTAILAALLALQAELSNLTAAIATARAAGMDESSLVLAAASAAEADAGAALAAGFHTEKTAATQARRARKAAADAAATADSAAAAAAAAAKKAGTKKGVGLKKM